MTTDSGGRAEAVRPAPVVLISGPELHQDAMALFRQRGARVVTQPPYTAPEALAAVAREEEVDGLVVRMGRITEEVLRASPRLRVVVKHGAGVDNIDVEAATRLGVPVLITPGANAHSVAEHVLALMFALAKNLRTLDARLRSGHWDKAKYRGMELRGKQLGLIGMGRIARRLVDLVQPLNMRIGAYDPYAPDSAFPPGVERFHRLTDLLPWADFLSLHCPLTDDTRGLIGEAELRQMKPEAFVINTARGGVIDEEALIRALRDGTIAGAGLDTFAVEPPAPDNPLWDLPNVVVTPHVAGVTVEALRDIGVGVVSNLFSVLDGESIPADALVNPGFEKAGRKTEPR